MRRCGQLALTLAVIGMFGFLLSIRVGHAETPKKGKLLYLTMTTGFRHESIPLSKDVVKQIGAKSGAFETAATEELAAFTPEGLKDYDAIMFNTTGELPMTDDQKKAFLDFVRSGGGFVAVHSATDTFYMWDEFNELIGGYFNGHPWHEMVTVEVVDLSSPLVDFLGKSFQINDEIYQVSDFRARDSHVLLRLDPNSVDLKKPGVQRRYYGWPVAWTRQYGKGRVYYNGLGHDDWVWNDPRYQEMLLRGIKWVMRLTD